MTITRYENQPVFSATDVRITGQTIDVDVDIAASIALPIDDSTPIAVNVTPNFTSQQGDVFYLKNTGSTDMRVNGSVTPVEFAYSPTRDCLVTSLTLMLGSFANGEQGHSNFGAVNGLTQGIDVAAEINSVEKTINHDRRIFNNKDLLIQGSSFEVMSFGRSGDAGTFYVVTFDFSGVAGGGYFLDATDGDRIFVRINDNLLAPAGADATHGLNDFSGNVKITRAF